MFSVEVNAETRTIQGVVISTLYRHTRQPTLGECLTWVKHVTRALSVKRTVAHFTITDDAGRLVTRQRWECTGSRKAYCPSKRRRFR